MRLAFVALSLACLGCGGYTARLPDGGRGQVNCAGVVPSVPVLVKDPFGQPAPSAVVTAVWLSYDGLTQGFGTDGRGVAVVPNQFGPGVVRVHASLNDLRSPVADLTFTGGQCVSAVSPASVTLQLE